MSKISIPLTYLTLRHCLVLQHMVLALHMRWSNMFSMSVGCLLNLFLRVLLLANDVFILRIEILRIHVIVLMAI